MYYKLIFSLVITLFFGSCGNNKKEAEIVLNDGMKWKVNAEMMPPLESSKKLISEFVNSGDKDYEVLAAKLKENNELLISSCNMKGESHNELHKWLHPYMALLDELDGANDLDEANEASKKIEASYDSFDQYFQ